MCYSSAGFVHSGCSSINADITDSRLPQMETMGCSRAFPESFVSFIKPHWQPAPNHLDFSKFCHALLIWPIVIICGQRHTGQRARKHHKQAATSSQDKQTDNPAHFDPTASLGCSRKQQGQSLFVPFYFPIMKFTAAMPWFPFGFYFKWKASVLSSPQVQDYFSSLVNNQLRCSSSPVVILCRVLLSCLSLMLQAAHAILCSQGCLVQKAQCQPA